MGGRSLQRNVRRRLAALQTHRSPSKHHMAGVRIKISRRIQTAPGPGQVTGFLKKANIANRPKLKRRIKGINVQEIAGGLWAGLQSKKVGGAGFILLPVGEQEKSAGATGWIYKQLYIQLTMFKECKRGYR